MTAVTTTPGAADVGAILPDGDTVTLESGTVVVMRELRAEETFAFLKIITKGLGAQADQLATLDAGDEEGFAKRLLMLALMALPNAFPETAAFIRLMVEPHGLIKGKPNKADRERNEKAKADLDDELENPTLDDLVTIVEAVVVREAPHLAALGKRLAGMLTLARRTGATR